MLALERLSQTCNFMSPLDLGHLGVVHMSPKVKGKSSVKSCDAARARQSYWQGPDMHPSHGDASSYANDLVSATGRLLERYTLLVRCLQTN